MLTLGIRLVIILPTLLFIIGIGLKGLVERKSIKECNKLDKNHSLGDTLLKDFIFVVCIDSLFISIANGLILIFQFQFSEIGVIAIIAGVILSMFILVGIYVEEEIALDIGFFGTFSLLGGELSAFSSYGFSMKIWLLPINEIFFTLIGMIIGGIIGYYLSILVSE